MSSRAHRPGDRVIRGIAHVYLANALMLPLGLIAAIYLTRTLGPAAYGVYALAVVIVLSVESMIAAPFTGMTIRRVAGAERWQPVAAAAFRAKLLLATVATVAVWGLAGPLARSADAPALEAFLRLFALDIPIFAAASLHGNTLVALERHGRRAVAGAARWVSRLALIVLFVEAGWSVEGALLGGIGASVVELVVARGFVRPRLLDEGVRIRELVATGWPLMILGLVMFLYTRLDLIALKMLGGSAEQTGHYAAAQNLALIPALLAGAVSTVLLATLTRCLRDGDADRFRAYALRVVRFGLILFPFAAAAAGCADGIVALVFGSAYLPAGDVLGPLLFAAVSVFLISTGSSVLIAADRPGTALAAAGPVVFPAIAGYLLLVPDHAGRGAAWVTCLATGACAMVVVTTVAVVGRVSPPVATLLRSAALSLLAFGVAIHWETTRPVLLLVKLASIGVGILIGLLFSGEWNRDERRALLGLLGLQRPSGRSTK